MPRKHICDVPGCGRPRERWQRTCTSCWSQLPDAIRTGIRNAFRQHRTADHRQFCKSARAHLDRAAAANAHRPTPQEAYARTERMLGEH